MASANKLLGQFDLVGIPPAPRGVPQIEVVFDVDANGIMNISAIDKSTGRKQQITIQSSGGLSEEQIQQMVLEAEKYKEDDEKIKKTVATKNEAETLIYSVEKQINDLKDKISSEDKSELERHMQQVREALHTPEGETDEETLRSRVKELQELSWKVSQKAYSQGASSTTAEGDSSNSSSSSSSGDSSSTQGGDSGSKA